MSSLAELLQKKSETLNLFSANDRLKLQEKHIPDSLAVLDFWHPKKGASILDLGTGGGLPGLALAEQCPDVDFILLDARGKKLQAVQEVVDELGLKNVGTVHGRIEELAHESAWREQFDGVTARALAELPTLLEYAAGFLKNGGRLFAWKTLTHGEELKDSEHAQTILGLFFEKSYDYQLPTGEARSILSFIKKGRLPSSYPRRVGLPLSKPL